MPIQKIALCEKSDRAPQWRCAQRWVTALAVTASMMPGANAQTRDMPASAHKVLQEPRGQPTIIAAPVITASPATKIDFSVSIHSADLVPPESFLIIRGLPPFFTMSAGKEFGKRSWRLPLDTLSNLKMEVPAQASSGRLKLELVLIDKNLQLVASAGLELSIGPTPIGTDNRAVEEEALTDSSRGETGGGRSAALQQRSEIEGNRPEALSGDETPEVGRGNEARSDGTPQEKRLEIAETLGSDSRANAHAKQHSGLQETIGAIAETRPKNPAGDTQLKQGAANAAETQSQTVGVTSPQANPEADKRGDQAQPRLSANNDRAASLAPGSHSEPAIKLAPPAKDAARAQAERLVTNGDRYLAQGNIVIARQYYLRAADLGVASAAVKLAATHDPHEMAQLGVVGMTTNLQEAKRWYQRAQILGAAEAEARLRRLETR